MILESEVFSDRAVLLREAIQGRVQPTDAEFINQFLSRRPVRQVDESIIDQGEFDSFATKATRQPVMKVEVKLQTKRRPGRDPQITGTEFLVDEIKIVVQAFTGGGERISLAGLLIVPWFIGVTDFLRGNNMHLTGLIAASCNNFLDAVFLFAGLEFFDEFNLQVVFCS